MVKFTVLVTRISQFRFSESIEMLGRNGSPYAIPTLEGSQEVPGPSSCIGEHCV